MNAAHLWKRLSPKRDKRVVLLTDLLWCRRCCLFVVVICGVVVVGDFLAISLLGRVLYPLYQSLRTEYSFSIVLGVFSFRT